MTLNNMADEQEDDTSLQYNWDNKLRHGQKDSATVDLKYDPDGNRIWKKSGGTERKYIVDIVGDLPVILMELNGSSIEKTYIYANGQIIAQHTGKYDQPRYFFLHDRLGSVRLVMDTSGDLQNRYIYDPFGKTYPAPDFEETVAACGSSRFTGQFFDSEIEQYYLRARQYYPYISRFTSRDPLLGQFEAPLTLHRYLYCKNDPINWIDPAGLWAYYITGSAMASWVGSGAGQVGVVWDDKGNVGIITIVSVGVGSPSWSAGVSIGITSAENILHLRDYGSAVGGSWGKGIFSIGAEYLKGEKYKGVGFNLGVGTALAPGLAGEIHAHQTFTTILPIESQTLTFEQIVRMQLHEAVDQAETLRDWWWILYTMEITDLDLSLLLYE